MSVAFTHAVNLASLARRLEKSRPRKEAPPSSKLRVNMRREAEVAACAAGADALTTLSRLADTLDLARHQVEALEGLEESNPPSRRHLYDAIQLHCAQLRAALRALETKP